MLMPSPPGEGPDLSHVDWSKVAQGKNCLPDLLDHMDAHFAARELVVFDDRRIGYGEATAQARRLSAGLLAHGIGKGERVGILLPNGPAFAVSWFAIAQIGAIAVPISTLASSAELRHIFASAAIGLLITQDSHLGHSLIERVDEARDGAGAMLPFLRAVWLWDPADPALRDAVTAHMPEGQEVRVRAAMGAVTPSDAISIIYTSGTTSLPKGVIHSHGAFLRSAQRWAASMDYRGSDRIYNAAPFFWVGGLVTGLLIAMEVGATLVGCSRSGAALADYVVVERCTLLAVSKLASEALKALPDLHDRDFSALRAGSLPDILPPHLRTRNQIYFGNALGMTETAGPHTLALPDVDDAHIGSMGPLAPGMQHRLVDRETGREVAPGAPGELHVRGDTLMLGYVGRERSDILDDDGWFRTGDLCSYRDGHLFLHGRIDNLIKVSGANVAPAEVEAALLTVEGIDAAFATGFADRRRGQVVGALVTLAPGAAIDADALLRDLRARLAAYKVPRLLVVGDALPTTATGKVEQRQARAMIEGGTNLLTAAARPEPA